SVRLGLRMADVSAIVFTHSHDDHLAEAELQYLSWMFVPEPRKEPLLIAGSATVIDKIRAGVNLERVNLELIELEAWQTRAVGDWNVTPIIANHDPTKICFNLIIERDGSSLLYATDTGWYGEETWKFLEGVRLAGVVVEASRAAHETYPGHLSLDDVIRFKDRLVSQETIIAGAPVVTTHHSHRSGLLHAQIEPLVEPSGIAVGYDGMEFTI
ncbi:MAG: MBL fold metallo-hydrolase, partial [Chthonomonadales bacterium]